MRLSNKILKIKPRSRAVSGGFIAYIILVALAASFLMGGCASKESIRKRTFNGSDSSYSRSKSSVSRSSKASRPATTKSGKRYHVLKRGETLYKVARRYGVSVATLKKTNRIRNERDVKIGTRIYLPKKQKKRSRKWRRSKTTSYVPRTGVKFIWPLKKVIVSSRFGIRSSKKHDGIDLRAPRGTTIYAAARGKVLFSGRGPSGYGNMVIIKHDKRTISIYAHNRRNLVREGEFVKQGRKIATVGRTGRATGYHLHFEIRVNRKPINPEKYLKRRG